jgi:hypothetical protein
MEASGRIVGNPRDLPGTDKGLYTEFRGCSLPCVASRRGRRSAEQTARWATICSCKKEQMAPYSPKYLMGRNLIL